MFGGAGAGGWSSGIGGQSMGPRAARNSDGWDDEYLGKAYDAEVMKRAWPYLIMFKKQALIAFLMMLLSASTAFAQPLLIGWAVTASVNGHTTKVEWLCAAMVGMAIVQWVSSYVQQIVTAWMGTRILLKLRSEMYDHMVGLS